MKKQRTTSDVFSIRVILHMIYEFCNNEYEVNNMRQTCKYFWNELVMIPISAIHWNHSFANELLNIKDPQRFISINLACPNLCLSSFPNLVHVGFHGFMESISSSKIHSVTITNLHQFADVDFNNVKTLHMINCHLYNDFIISHESIEKIEKIEIKNCVLSTKTVLNIMKLKNLRDLSLINVYLHNQQKNVIVDHHLNICLESLIIQNLNCGINAGLNLHLMLSESLKNFVVERSKNAVSFSIEMLHHLPNIEQVQLIDCDCIYGNIKHLKSLQKLKQLKFENIGVQGYIFWDHDDFNIINCKNIKQKHLDSKIQSIARNLNF